MRVLTTDRTGYGAWACPGADPRTLTAGSTDLDTVSGDLAHDATAVAGLGKQAAGAAPDQVGQLAESVLAALGGALTAGSVLASGLSTAASMAGEQLVKATGGGH